MNRLIKFRVWDTKLNKYVPFDSIPVHDFNSKEYIYQQFIGLYDSKGVEIYEGDLVKGSKNELTLVEYDAPEYTFRYKFYYDNGDWDWSFYGWGTSEDVVSGNILENKNLYEKYFKER